MPDADETMFLVATADIDARAAVHKIKRSLAETVTAIDQKRRHQQAILYAVEAGDEAAVKKKKELLKSIEDLTVRREELELALAEGEQRLAEQEAAERSEGLRKRWGVIEEQLAIRDRTMTAFSSALSEAARLYSSMGKMGDNAWSMLAPLIPTSDAMFMGPNSLAEAALADFVRLAGIEQNRVDWQSVALMVNGSVLAVPQQVGFQKTSILSRKPEPAEDA
jgi:hypothetical protein